MALKALATEAVPLCRPAIPNIHCPLAEGELALTPLRKNDLGKKTSNLAVLHSDTQVFLKPLIAHSQHHKWRITM